MPFAWASGARSPRRATLLLLLATLAGAAVLAVGLPELRLEPGLPLPEVKQGAVSVARLHGAGRLEMSVRRLPLVVLAMGAGAVALYAVWIALRGVRLRDLVRAAVRGLAALAATYVVLLIILATATPETRTLRAPPIPPPLPMARAPLGEPPSVLTWLVAAGILLGATLVAAGLLRRRTPAGSDALDRLGREADDARAALRAGEDARGVILACYARMSAALAEAHDLHRPTSMTAAEFRELLAAHGFPRGPVEELTRLFENVRYGAWSADAGQEARALACLDAIVEHCRTAPPPPRSEGRSTDDRRAEARP